MKEIEGGLLFSISCKLSSYQLDIPTTLLLGSCNVINSAPFKFFSFLSWHGVNPEWNKEKVEAAPPVLLRVPFCHLCLTSGKQCIFPGKSTGASISKLGTVCP